VIVCTAFFSQLIITIMLIIVIVMLVYKAPDADFKADYKLHIVLDYNFSHTDSRLWNIQFIITLN